MCADIVYILYTIFNTQVIKINFIIEGLQHFISKPRPPYRLKMKMYVYEFH